MAWSYVILVPHLVLNRMERRPVHQRKHTPVGQGTQTCTAGNFGMEIDLIKINTVAIGGAPPINGSSNMTSFGIHDVAMQNRSARSQ